MGFKPMGLSTKVSVLKYSSYMALDKEKKEKLIKKFGLKSEDTGSPEVQIALLSERMKELAEHLKIHKKDNHSRRGLISMVRRRRKLLDYIKKASQERYKKIIEKLGLKK